MPVGRLTARTGAVVAEIVEVEDIEGVHYRSAGIAAVVAAAGAAVDGDIRHGAERAADPAAAVVAGSDSAEDKCRRAAPGASRRDMSWHLSIGDRSLMWSCLGRRKYVRVSAVGLRAVGYRDTQILVDCGRRRSLGSPYHCQ